ncbi:MAG: glycine dehydrogenase (aminomethyl-transferring) [Candidatus Schekmanbacteria bacterium RBG_13_48_7]|uniref:Probable glycine dehydrogenase (decarboxylating) subunit 1 n=1 Tax=Candidatus Schekmanbacteria bacterium RBG_13_48_7 TaxID=1817878 RepID=A0A1F7RLG1_9BACT|nr:MAG: glycine dehydrogenase (aminomethyl-transferring) [Candidatus Schekmanbacteria bacterium RBG_13_48_7]
MLKSIGVDSIDTLFADIPEEIRFKNSLNIPDALSESELKRHMIQLMCKNKGFNRKCCFLGGGSYNHFIPSVIGALTSRAEFYTAYTPYQPEISQGTLQAVFEYQTLICQLTGMDVSNASMYDGASGLAEAILMAMRTGKKTEILISRALNPHYNQVIRTYLCNTDAVIKEIGWDDTGKTSIDELQKTITKDTCAVVIQNPNFFGVIEDFHQVANLAHANNVIAIYGFTEGFSLGLLKSPGEMEADIVAGEGQSFGIPVSFGGPYLGVFACREKYMRKMPGRLVGLTQDHDGNRGYVLTLSTREQHIRREKATSNICTNEGLCALTASIFLSTLGKNGLRELAIQNVQKTNYALKNISGIPNLKIRFSGSVFNEFVIQSQVPVNELNQLLREDGIIGGIPLECHYPELADGLLFCFTEMHTKGDIDYLVTTLQKHLK